MLQRLLELRVPLPPWSELQDQANLSAGASPLRWVYSNTLANPNFCDVMVLVQLGTAGSGASGLGRPYVLRVRHNLYAPRS